MTISTSNAAVLQEERTLSLPTQPLSIFSRWQNLGIIVGNEVYKGLLIQWSYKFNLLMESIMLSFMFVGITFFVGNGELQPERLPPSLLGFLVTFYAMVAISNMAYNLREETQQGTLEQWYMSPAHSSIVQLGRTISTFIVTSLTIIPVGLPLMWVFDIRFAWRWEALPVFVILLLGVYGFGFVVGGATLVFKNIGPLANMIQNFLLFLNGAFLPVTQFPEWLKTLALTLPTTQGIIALRRIVLDNEPIAALVNDGSLMWLTIHSMIYLFAGLLVFMLAERFAKKRGLLGQY
ncbi:MAG: ABC transporter permease [Chloroflexota bacterium]